ncbi:hypothetical protein ACH3XW_45640 [Acanthocheilonema viteae]
MASLFHINVGKKYWKLESATKLTIAALCAACNMQRFSQFLKNFLTLQAVKFPASKGASMKTSYIHPLPWVHSACIKYANVSILAR